MKNNEELLNLVENLFLFDRFLFFSIFVQNKYIEIYYNKKF